MNRLPDYACVIVRDSGRGFLFEARDAAARHAAGRLTCFGGRREAGEEPLACLRRELAEELAWEPPVADLAPALRFLVDGRYVALFYRHAGPPPAAPVCRLPGRAAVWRPDAADPDISPWHRAALAAWLAGEEECRLPARPATGQPGGR